MRSRRPQGDLVLKTRVENRLDPKSRSLLLAGDHVVGDGGDLRLAFGVAGHEARADQVDLRRHHLARLVGGALRRELPEPGVLLREGSTGGEHEDSRPRVIELGRHELLGHRIAGVVIALVADAAKISLLPVENQPIVSADLEAVPACGESGEFPHPTAFLPQDLVPKDPSLGLQLRDGVR